MNSDWSGDAFCPPSSTLAQVIDSDLGPTNTPRSDQPVVEVNMATNMKALEPGEDSEPP